MKHQFYETGDSDAPQQIKDRNGEVVLSFCRRCRRGESELSTPCLTAPVHYFSNFINPVVALAYFSGLWNGVAWERRADAPRREYYCNDVEVPYSYGRDRGRRTYNPSPWPPAAKIIQGRLKEYTNYVNLEVCFLNGYEDERDQLGWHADDSPEMDDNRPIAIVTLGAEREIRFRCKGSPGAQSESLILQNGSLCVMAPGMQDTHEHRIPKAGHPCGPRVSLTFRGYVEL